MLQDHKIIVIRLNNQELLRKYRLLSKAGKIVLESLLEMLFDKVEPIEIQNAYISGGEKGVKEFVVERIIGNLANIEIDKEKERQAETPQMTEKKQTSKNFSVKGDLQGFWG